MKKLLLAAAATAMIGSAAGATPTTFFGEDTNGGSNATTHPTADSAHDDFFSHLIGVGTESFESYAVGSGTPLAITFGLAGTATLTGTGNVQSTANGSGVGRFAITGSKYFEATGTFGITFSAPVAAFGFYATDLGDVGASLTLTLTAADNTVSTIAVPNVVNGSANGSALYFGFFDTAKTYKSISFAGAGSDVFGFDDFSIGSQEQVSETPVPEPAMLGLFGLGAIGLGVARRRRAA